jgi:hypothetical protein
MSLFAAILLLRGRSCCLFGRFFTLHKLMMVTSQLQMLEYCGCLLKPQGIKLLPVGRPSTVSFQDLLFESCRL